MWIHNTHNITNSKKKKKKDSYPEKTHKIPNKKHTTTLKPADVYIVYVYCGCCSSFFLVVIIWQIKMSLPRTLLYLPFTIYILFLFEFAVVIIKISHTHHTYTRMICISITWCSYPRRKVSLFLTFPFTSTILSHLKPKKKKRKKCWMSNRRNCKLSSANITLNHNYNLFSSFRVSECETYFCRCFFFCSNHNAKKVKQKRHILTECLSQWLNGWNWRRIISQLDILKAEHFYWIYILCFK